MAYEPDEDEKKKEETKVSNTQATSQTKAPESPGSQQAFEYNKRKETEEGVANAQAREREQDKLRAAAAKKGGGSTEKEEMTEDEKKGGMAGLARYNARIKKKAQTEGAKEALKK